MVLVGLTGGVATGKSTVARMFRNCGAHIIDADALARQVVIPGKPAWREIRAAFGDGMLKQDRTLDRAALGQVVFHNPKQLKRLERIIHPRVAREQARLARNIAKHNPGAVIIYDAPVLIEAGAHTRMDRILVVTADQETQIRRLRQRDGLSRTQALGRIRSQMPLAVKARYADYLVDGRTPLRKLPSLIRQILNALQRKQRTDSLKRWHGVRHPKAKKAGNKTTHRNTRSSSAASNPRRPL